MLKNITFNLSYGYLIKQLVEEQDEDVYKKILSSLDGDRIECYYGWIPSAKRNSGVFDYLILYKMDDGFKPIIIKNFATRKTSLEDCFENYYQDCSNEEIDENNEYHFTKEFQHGYFGHADYYLTEVLELVQESSREKFYQFLQDKYNPLIKQEVVLF